MLTERFEYSITKLPDGQLEVRQERVIEDNGAEISRLFHRHVVEPDTNIETIEVPEVKEIAQVVWSSKVVTDYIEKKRARLAKVDEGLVVKDISSK